MIRIPTLAAGLAAVLAVSVPPAIAHAQTETVEVNARAFDGFRFIGGGKDFGPLTFLGGLELNAPYDAFGSFSGLEFGPDGRLYAITDRGHWLSARFVEDDHVPVGLTDAWMARMVGPDGAILERKSVADAEGLRLDADGSLLVSYEIVDAIRRFRLPLDPSAAPATLPLPRFVRGLRPTAGLEALARSTPGGPLAGAVVAIAERSTNSDGNHRGFVLGGRRAGEFAIGRNGEFDITDAAFLPDGDLLLLERRFNFSSGIAVRLRRVRASLIRPGRTVTGQVLLEGGPGDQIDNLEGLAVRALPDGGAVVTLISDDNHNILQRTLLLQFRIAPNVPPLPPRRPTVGSGGAERPGPQEASAEAAEVAL